MNIISDGIGDELQGFVGCGESGSSSGRLLITCKSRRSVLRRIRNIPIGLFPQCYSSSVPPWLHRLILLPWVLYGILQRCDLVQTLQREVSWRWRPPSISLMDWKRFTRKSNKPGGRTSRTARTHTHTHTHTHRDTLASWKLVLLPRGTNKTACLCTALPLRPIVWQQQDCPNGFGCNRRALMFFDLWKHGAGRGAQFWNLLFKDLKSDGEGRRGKSIRT